MKKVMAIIVALVIVVTCSVAVLAVPSPSGNPNVNVKVVATPDVPAKIIFKVLDEGGTISVTADTAAGVFNGWSIYKRSGTYVPAVLGVDYEFISGSSETVNAVIKVYTDLVICADYNKTITDPETGASKTDQSPKTGESTAIYVACFMCVLACGFVTKKQLCK